MKAKDIMTTNVITVNQSAPIPLIAKILVENSISGVPVVDNENNLVGMVSEGDLLRKETNPRLPDHINILGAFIYYNGVERYHDDLKKLMAEQAEAIMTEDVITIDPDTEIAQIGKLMLENGIKRLPVVQDGKLVGLVSRRDMIKLLIEND